MASMDIKYVKGIGEKRAKLFNRLGIRTAYALLRYYPRAYKDFSHCVPIISVPSDETAAIKCKITAEPDVSETRKGMTIITFTAIDETGYVNVTLFNNKFVLEKLKKDKTVVLYGKLCGTGGRRTMSAPDIIEPENAVITPIYPITAGLFQGNIRSAVKHVLENIPPDPIPDKILSEYRLPDLNFSLNNIHFPVNTASLELSKRRLVFEELFLFRLGMMLIKSDNRKMSGAVVNESYVEEFSKNLPFTLTKSQKSAINDCITDMKSGKSMSRLIEGDVGSGKTAIAAAVIHTAAKNNMQCAMMAPTAVLAKQIFDVLKEFLSPFGITVELLVSATKKSEKDKIKERLKNGETLVAVGTQALLQDNVVFKNLGLVICDEQHRFGVAQRAKLLSKGKNPHTLVMSATPIPRTLGLIIYGDLDISAVSSVPSGRLPIKTYCVGTEYRERIYNFIKKNVANGKKAYIVCPLVEDGEETDGLVSSVSYFEEVKNGSLKGINVGLLHGKMKPAEKDKIMQEFKYGNIDVLVTTTVIEVGVDVPEATVMVIENAEMFGLSALHQLRGRVGRNSEQSYCILISNGGGENTEKRLSVICDTTDGFKIADEDLKLRGPGDFLGNRQHGLPEFRIADLECDLDMLKTAGEAAKKVLESDPDLSKTENINLKKAIDEMFSVTSL